MNFDIVLINAKLSSVIGHSYKVIPECTIGIRKGKIEYVGKASIKGKKIIDVENKLVTPGLVECHTHLIFAGNRAKEFEMRQFGKSYEEIAKQGGGIWSTVLETRNATEKKLYALAKQRIYNFLVEGVTTVEIKSGYGLDYESELKILRVATMLQKKLPITIVRTFLGAHSVPREFKNNADEYIDLLCTKFLPEIKKQHLAEAVDIFCERITFNKKQTEKLFFVATKLGFPVKIHAEQLSNSGGAQIGAKYNALSVDHLDFAKENDMKALKKSNSVAVVMPGAYYFLNSKKKPPIALLHKYEIPIAISTDFNPGTSPLNSLLIAANFAIHFFDLSIEEAFKGVTINAAKALGIQKHVGSVEVGKNADLVVWNALNLDEVFYGIATSKAQTVVKNGKVVYHSINKE